ncbi:helix-turn-helix domain-containing protein [Mesorhizobium sp.]|uniref:helix-turn-helix domain-containing protein n=1 Tax=Mesorhizobium sp. TaxID=1871066 RepID=UPI000FE73E50|nr:helix-turn-helix domain-containing protein [Mesorhizobium sp.]RWD49995.1 MAG: sigma-54-dependent Fis family transcriptional regulator [Mesorhizobium sp.]RWE61856.1 MAG: sigma-54-dependent Fis family transcriptional regulator [Mesorhizobium sp.]RWE86984.1 MAG: sigma-54-dependent Fis family transcriptional regulator [Mesorhizobium sp.]RWF07559.1 MAG: sigma-54-dependent Fis family transcriptional regulator [Mesorhizobium sp.]RWF22491.1 MAG: sigma-54-dependent Fis family transcriptional regulat
MDRYTATLHADRIQASIASDAAAKSALVASWRRSASLHRLDPAGQKLPRRLTEIELSMARQRVEPLLAAARSSLDRLYLAVGGVGCCVLLADADGVPVDRRGAPVDDEIFHSWGLWTGSVWSEHSEGTNGIGTCLVEQRALTIHRDQHFFTRNTLLSCTTAPVYDHLGNLVAALDVSSCRADLTEGFVNLIAMAVSEAARRIEADNFRMAFPKARILLAPVADKSTGALVAVDADDLVVGATRAARLALGITQDCLARPLPAADLLGDAPAVSEDLTEAERSVVQRALARSQGNVSAAAQNLGISRATLHRKLARFGIRRPH